MRGLTPRLGQHVTVRRNKPWILVLFISHLVFFVVFCVSIGAKDMPREIGATPSTAGHLRSSEVYNCDASSGSSGTMMRKILRALGESVGGVGGVGGGANCNAKTVDAAPVADLVTATDFASRFLCIFCFPLLVSLALELQLRLDFMYMIQSQRGGGSGQGAGMYGVGVGSVSCSRA